jgi:hypothetical protein
MRPCPETVSRNGYPNRTNCTYGGENQEWNCLETAQHAKSGVRQYAPRKVGSPGLAKTSLHELVESRCPSQAGCGKTRSEGSKLATC